MAADVGISAAVGNRARSDVGLLDAGDVGNHSWWLQMCGAA